MMQLKVNPESFSFLKKPGFQLGAAAGVGVLLIGFWLIILIIPQQAASLQVNSDLESAMARSRQAERMPIPVKATAAEIEALQRQVPLQEENSNLLKQLQEHASQSGVQIQSFTLGDVELDKQAKLENLIEKASQVEEKESTGATLVKPQDGSSSTGESVTTLASQSVKVEVKGYFRQTMDFMSQLSKQERLIRITDWNVAQSGKNTNGTASQSDRAGEAAVAQQSEQDHAKASSGDTPNGLPIVLTLTGEIYTAPQYVGKLKEAPAPTASPGAQRTDPTWTDNIMRELLKSNPSNP